jgi:hypothetical protein
VFARTDVVADFEENFIGLNGVFFEVATDVEMGGGELVFRDHFVTCFLDFIMEEFVFYVQVFGVLVWECKPVLGEGVRSGVEGFT